MKNCNDKHLVVHLNQEPIYDIVLTETFDGLSAELTALGSEKKKLCIVTDSNVAPIYLDEIKNQSEGMESQFRRVIKKQNGILGVSITALVFAVLAAAGVAAQLLMEFGII